MKYLLEDSLPTLNLGKFTALYPGSYFGHMAIIELFSHVVDLDTDNNKDKAIDFIDKYVRYYNISRQSILGFVERNLDKFFNKSYQDIDSDADFNALYEKLNNLLSALIHSYGNLSTQEITQLNFRASLLREVYTGFLLSFDYDNESYRALGTRSLRRHVERSKDEQILSSSRGGLIARKPSSSLREYSLERTNKVITLFSLGECPFFSLAWTDEVN